MEGLSRDAAMFKKWPEGGRERGYKDAHFDER